MPTIISIDPLVWIILLLLIFILWVYEWAKLTRLFYNNK